MMPDHSPQSWTAIPTHELEGNPIRDIPGWIIVGTLPHVIVPYVEDATAARLIAAAPDLLAACEAMYALLEEMNGAVQLPFNWAVDLSARAGALRTAIGIAHGKGV